MRAYLTGEPAVASSISEPQLPAPVGFQNFILGELVVLDPVFERYAITAEDASAADEKAMKTRRTRITLFLIQSPRKLH
ncbi:Uncharacterised protein [uncultured archaeon]|nr:Uncharacterised protein [uncultured archaeon]